MPNPGSRCGHPHGRLPADRGVPLPVRGLGAGCRGRWPRQPGRRPPPVRRPPKPERLTDGLLRGGRSSAELERLTGIARGIIRYRGAALGVERDELQRADRSWVPGVKARLGKVPDRVLAREAGVSVSAVGRARRDLGIQGAPKPSRATSGEGRARLRELSKAALGAFLATLDPLDRAIVRERLMAARPVALAQIGARFGVTRQAVALRERKLPILL